MATVEEIEVSYRSQIASPAQADAAALDAVADGLDKVADSVEVTDAKIQRSTKSGVGFLTRDHKSFVQGTGVVLGGRRIINKNME